MSDAAPIGFQLGSNSVRQRSVRVKRRVVWVTWSDSTMVPMGWTDAGQIFPLQTVTITTVGILHSEYSDRVELVMSTHGEGKDELVLSPFTIPRGCIVKMKTLGWC
jgi:hypothetical protein